MRMAIWSMLRRRYRTFLLGHRRSRSGGHLFRACFR